MNDHAKMLHIRVDEALGALASDVLAKAGLTLSDAVNILLNKIVAEGSLPAGLGPFDDPDPDACDEWFRAMVQEALDEEGPGIPHEEAMARVRDTLDRAIRDQG